MTRGRLAFTLVAINIYAFALSFMWNALNPLVIPYMVARLAPDIKNTLLGLITAAGLVVATIVQPWAGGLSDRSTSRWGRRRPFILFGTLFDFLFLAMLAMSGNYWILFASYCLIQFSSNVAHGPHQGFIPDLVEDDKKGIASGVKNLLELLALVLCSAIVGTLLGNDQPGAALAVIGTVVLVATAITLLAVQEQPAVRDARAAAVPALSFRGVVHALRTHTTFAWYVVSRFLILSGLAAVRTFAQNYIQDVLRADNPAALAGQLMTVLGLCVLLVVLPAGYLADRVGRKRLNVVSAFVGAAGTLAMLGIQSYNHLVIFGAVVGIAVGIFMSANWALAMDLIPAAEAALFLGLTNLATAGSGVAAGLLGPLIDSFNRMSPASGYNMLFVAAAVMWLAGGLILLRLPLRR